MELHNTVTGVTAQVETDLNPPVCRNSLMNAMSTKTVYVIEETGATFAYTNLDIALSNLRAEIVAGMDASFHVVQAPDYLEGNDLAEWCASNGGD